MIPVIKRLFIERPPPTPVPKITQQEQDPRLSFNFSGIQNTSRAGVAVPVIYGQVLTGSVVISAGIETAQVEV